MSLKFDEMLDSYDLPCLVYWWDKEKDCIRHEEWTSNDKYGDGCAGPSEETCPIHAEKEIL